MNAMTFVRKDHAAPAPVLKVGPRTSAFERKADHVADKGMSGTGSAAQWSFSRMSIAAPPQRKSFSGGPAGPDGGCAEGKGNGILQRKASGQAEAGHAPAIVHDVLRSPGAPLDRTARSFFEPRFGHDFSKVRIHTGDEASRSARSVGAVAYTVGQGIVFDAGHYSPNSTEGRKLLAHELTHTVQQGGAAQAGELRVGSPADASEKEAERTASSALGGGPARGAAGVPSHSRLSVQRQVSPTGLPAVPALPELDPAANSSPMVAAAIGSLTVDQFETGKSDIPASHKAELSRTAKYIVSLLKQYPGSTIQIVGHTDAVGKDAENETLGQARADSVQKALVDSGVPAEAIHTESRGATDLLVKTKAGNGRNRRAAVRFQPARQFHGLMNSHLDMDPPGKKDPSGGFSTKAPVLPDIYHLPPDIGRRPGPLRPPSDSPDAFKSLPSDIPWELMDLSGYNEGYTSHGGRAEYDESIRAKWGELYQSYYATFRGKLKLEDAKKAAAKAANSTLSSMSGQDQTRDHPNPTDQANKDWKDLYPGATTIGPFNPPFKPFQYKF